MGSTRAARGHGPTEVCLERETRMWNSFRTDTEGGIVAGVSMMTGGGGNPIHTYIARPDGGGPYPGVVMTHHVPGWDESYREFARRSAEQGFISIVPNLFGQLGQGP